MSGMDAISSVLRNYLQPAAARVDTAAHFDQVAAAVPVGTLSQGITAAFESSETPPFHDMLSQLFTSSDPAQRAAMLSTLLNAIPADQRAAVAATLGVGNAVSGTVGSVAPSVTSQQAQQVAPSDVAQAAQQAAANTPSIVAQMGSFYAQHPTLVKTLGSLAMMVAMRKIARHYPT